jgi:hypothetical protein
MRVNMVDEKRMKSVEIVLKMGDGGRGRMIRGKSKIYCKHICKYHNVSPVQLLYANNILKKLPLRIALVAVFGFIILGFYFHSSQIVFKF